MQPTLSSARKRITNTPSRSPGGAGYPGSKFKQAVANVDHIPFLEFSARMKIRRIDCGGKLGVKGLNEAIVKLRHMFGKYLCGEA